MTFLEYVAERLMGPPVSGSCWRCPYCDSSGASFSIRPPKDKPDGTPYPIKFQCFRCGEWGDERDLMKLFHPLWGKALCRLEVEKLCGSFVNSKSMNNGEMYSIRGSGSNIVIKGRGNKPKDDPKDVGLTWADLMSDLEKEETSKALALQILTQLKKNCDYNDVSMEALLKYWIDFQDWIHEGDQRHLAECDDPECDTYMCRAERGLPALTREYRASQEYRDELEKKEKKEKKERIASRKRIRRAMRNGRAKQRC